MNDSQYARSTSHAGGWSKGPEHAFHSKVGHTSQVDKSQLSKDSMAGTSIMLTPNNPRSFQYPNWQQAHDGKVGRKDLETSALAQLRD